MVVAQSSKQLKVKIHRDIIDRTFPRLLEESTEYSCAVGKIRMFEDADRTLVLIEELKLEEKLPIRTEVGMEAGYAIVVNGKKHQKGEVLPAKGLPHQTVLVWSIAEDEGELVCLHNGQTRPVSSLEIIGRGMPSFYGSDDGGQEIAEQGALAIGVTASWKERLKRHTVVVAGMSHAGVLMSARLVQEGVGKLRLIDDQNHSPAKRVDALLHKSRVQAVGRMVHGISDETLVVGYDMPLASAGGLTSLLRESHLFVSCNLGALVDQMVVNRLAARQLSPHLNIETWLEPDPTGGYVKFCAAIALMMPGSSCPYCCGFSGFDERHKTLATLRGVGMDVSEAHWGAWNLKAVEWGVELLQGCYAGATSGCCLSATFSLAEGLKWREIPLLDGRNNTCSHCRAGQEN